LAPPLIASTCDRHISLWCRL